MVAEGVLGSLKEAVRSLGGLLCSGGCSWPFQRVWDSCAPQKLSVTQCRTPHDPTECLCLPHSCSLIPIALPRELWGEWGKPVVCPSPSWEGTGAGAAAQPPVAWEEPGQVLLEDSWPCALLSAAGTPSFLPMPTEGLVLGARGACWGAEGCLPPDCPCSGDPSDHLTVTLHSTATHSGPTAAMQQAACKP